MAGCLAQRYKQEIVDEIPEVDAVLGTTTYDAIVETVEKVLEGQKELHFEDIDRLVPEQEGARALTTGGHYAYLKIAEGCDKHCTYCIIPKVRGNYRSVPMEQLLKEARELAGGRRQRTDSGGPGDDPLWKRYLRREEAAGAFKEAG